MTKVRKLINENVAFVGLILLILLGVCVQRTFIYPENLTNLVRSASITGFLAIGMTFVILCGSIDLSVASVFAMGGYWMLYFAERSLVLAFLVPIVSGLIVGLLNGILINKLSIPPFIGTLATQLLVRGFVQLLTNEQPFKPSTIPSTVLWLSRGNILGGFPAPFLLFIIAACAMAFVLKRKFIGRSMYIVGGNSEAATMMGVNVFRTMTIAHMMCGVFAALAGMLYVSRVGVASPIAGTGYEMYAIAAVVIGGASMNGGIGKMSGSFIGALIMASFSNIFKMQTVIGAVWKDVAVGIVLLVVILLQAVIAMKGTAKSNK